MPSPHVFQRACAAELPIAVAGDGPYLIDADGGRYLDASGGAAVSTLGHSCARVAEAIAAQAASLAYAHTAFFTSEPAERLAARLVGLAPEGIERAYFVSGGSEAMESALKLARQYHIECGRPERSAVIGRRQSYHGNTLGALAVSGNVWRREPFAPLLSPNVHHVDPCHYWRWGEEGESPEMYGLRAANSLERKILELGPEAVAAFVAEPVVGATMGAVPPAPGYFARIREICDKYGVLLILDEVMCGMGRTGTLFACEQEALRPDMITIAKGLGAGAQPIGATLVSGEIHDAIASGGGAVLGGHTYLGHPIACAASLAVLDEIEERDLLSNVRRRGAELRDALDARFGQHPHVGDIRGRGLFVGLEFVEDRTTKRPLPRERKFAATLKRRAMARGLMCYPNGGTVDGATGDHVLLAPPYIVEAAHIEEIVDKLALAIAESLDEVAAAVA